MSSDREQEYKPNNIMQLGRALNKTILNSVMF